MAAVAIVSVGPERIDDLTNFWLQLHQHIESFLVVSDVRGQGVGRRLLDAALAHLRKVGIRTAGLDVVSTNTAARRFYEREGFVPTFLHMYRAISVA